MRHSPTAAIFTATAALLLATGCSNDKPDRDPGPIPPPPSARATPQPTRTHRTATVAARTAAAKILHANVQHYRNALNTGRRTWGTSQFGPWQTKTLTDLTYQDAFTTADQHFTADTEPDSINTWHDDIAAATDAINQWAQHNTLATAAEPAPASHDAEAALTKADQDAANVAAGK
ncbi:hypothetical protein [Streptomyces sp. TLI_146]|uniref:hypothetical protein n=1 Tax=Streptomyces sp. TLI_146 TaxID=1938858 RepID=UPI000C70F9E6|nr:hypothetical protein [Streptomyces sp. TLI_146]PKV82605.1 hypothetical protein BX283_0042 [Streptomyces sp. TLI_146]